ncbi:MAG: hypothetical protein V5A57_02210 [Candidatus Paceibacterota bacterium]
MLLALIAIVFLSSLILSLREIKLTEREEVEREVSRWWLLRNMGPALFGIGSATYGFYRVIVTMETTIVTAAFIFLGLSWAILFILFFPSQRIKYLNREYKQ